MKKFIVSDKNPFSELPSRFTGIVITGNTKEWYKKGVLHREEGPAVEWADGTKEWWVEGQEVTKKDFPRAVLNYKLKTVISS